MTGVWKAITCIALVAQIATMFYAKDHGGLTWLNYEGLVVVGLAWALAEAL